MYSVLSWPLQAAELLSRYWFALGFCPDRVTVGPKEAFGAVKMDQYFNKTQLVSSQLSVITYLALGSEIRHPQPQHTHCGHKAEFKALLWLTSSMIFLAVSGLQPKALDTISSKLQKSSQLSRQIITIQLVPVGRFPAYRTATAYFIERRRRDYSSSEGYFLPSVSVLVWLISFIF